MHSRELTRVLVRQTLRPKAERQRPARSETNHWFPLDILRPPIFPDVDWIKASCVVAAIDKCAGSTRNSGSRPDKHSHVITT